MRTYIYIIRHVTDCGHMYYCFLFDDTQTLQQFVVGLQLTANNYHMSRKDVVVVVWFGDPCESPGVLLFTAATENLSHMFSTSKRFY